MKRWLIIAIPLILVSALMFIRPPSFASHNISIPASSNSTGATGGTSGGIKPGINGGGDDEGNGKPAYGGHEKDNYDKD